MVDQQDLDLPKAQIKRVLLSKLPSGQDNKNFAVSKEALLAFVEATKVFIGYLGSTANDICREAKRQTISADDVIKAMEELEFGELVPQLKEHLEAYKKWNKEKNQKRAEASKACKKRKAEEKAEAAAKGGEGAAAGGEGAAAGGEAGAGAAGAGEGGQQEGGAIGAGAVAAAEGDERGDGGPEQEEGQGEAMDE